MDLPEVRDYADRCFRSCDSERERKAMQRKVKAIISRALMDGRVREIDWDSYPKPHLDRREIAREGLTKTNTNNGAT